MNMQTLILDAVEKGVTDAGLTFLHDPKYANTGVIRALDSSLNIVGELRYDFQAKTCRFGNSGERLPVVSHTYGRRRESGQAEWVASTLQEVIEIVVAAMTAGRG